MKKQPIIALAVVLAVGAGLAALALKTLQSDSAETEENGASEARGPHGGRLLRDGDFAAEVTIFERGVPPEFRVYFYDQGAPVDPAQVDLTIELHRLGGRVDRFGFIEEGDYLVGDQIVAEPHSFDVRVAAEHKGARHEWNYESYEGRTELSPQAIERTGIEIERAQPREIASSISTYGRIAPNEDRLAYVIPRFPGAVKEIRKRLGDPVERGEVVALVESNESLQTYEAKSPIDGTIIEKNVTTGELVSEGQAIYTVADLETVWVDLNIYPQDFTRVKVGQKAFIEVGESLPIYEGEIEYLSPFGSENSQTMLARVVLPNPEGYLRPGIFASGRIVVERVEVPVAIKLDALQTFRDWQAVFIKEGNVLEARPVELGRRDDQWVEVRSGLEAGQEYAAENSFVVKADILKSGAAHHH